MMLGEGRGSKLHQSRCFIHGRPSSTFPDFSDSLLLSISFKPLAGKKQLWSRPSAPRRHFPGWFCVSHAFKHMFSAKFPLSAQPGSRQGAGFWEGLKGDNSVDLDFRSGCGQKKGTRGPRHNKHIFSVCWSGWQEEEEETKEPRLCRFKSTPSPRDGEEKRIVKWAFPLRQDEMCLRACSLLYRYWFDVLSPVNIEVLICLFAAACQNRMQVIYKRGKTVRACAYRAFSFWRARAECFLRRYYFLVSHTTRHVETATCALHNILHGILHNKRHKMIKHKV